MSHLSALFSSSISIFWCTGNTWHAPLSLVSWLTIMPSMKRAHVDSTWQRALSIEINLYTKFANLLSRAPPSFRSRHAHWPITHIMHDTPILSLARWYSNPCCHCQYLSLFTAHSQRLFASNLDLLSFFLLALPPICPLMSPFLKCFAQVQISKILQLMLVLALSKHYSYYWTGFEKSFTFCFNSSKNRKTRKSLRGSDEIFLLCYFTFLLSFI